MRPIYVYKLMARGNHGVARVSLDDGGIHLVAGEDLALRVLEACLLQPALITERVDSKHTRKRSPRNEEEAIVARLKRYVPKPYFLSRAPVEFPEKYQKSYPVETLGSFEE